MAHRVKVRAGDRPEVTLPKDVLEEMEVDHGSDLYAVKTAEGILLCRPDPELAEVMRIYDKMVARYGNALRQLND